MRRTLTIFLAALVAIALTGTLSAQNTTARSGNDPVLTVNGEVVTYSEFFLRLQRMRAQDFVILTNPPTLRQEASGLILMNSLINERLILQWATKTSQMPSDTEINAEYEKLKTQPALADALKKNIVTEELIKYELRWQKARFNIATTAVSVSAKEIEEFYKNHTANYTIPERWTLLAVNTRDAQNVTKIQADLKADKPFEEIVKAYCDDPTLKSRNGQFGTILANDVNLPANFRTALQKLQPGQTTSALKVDAQIAGTPATVATWWFIRMVKKEPGTVRPFADVKSQVEQSALLQKAGGLQVAEKKIAESRKTAVIKVFLPGYEQVESKPKK